jgi:hypothetical protein
MGRSPGDAVGIGRHATLILEKVRRVLGRLCTHTTVHQLPMDDLVASLVVPPADLLGMPVPSNGLRSGSLRIECAALAAGIPTAPSGGNGVDLAAVTTVVSVDGAFASHPCRTHLVPLPDDYAIVHNCHAPSWVVTSPIMRVADVIPAGGVERRLALDAVKATAVTAIPVGRIRPTIPVARRVRDALNRPFPRPAVRSAIAAAYRVPLVKHSSSAMRGAGLQMAQLVRLADAANIPVDRVALIGIFPNIPVAVVSRMSVEGSAGELRIWLRPGAAGLSGPQKLITLIVGRNTTTGKTIQAVA